MEQALEGAVTRGMQRVESQLHTVPGLAFFVGPVRVHGFDVEYPVVRRSILWSMSTLQWDGGVASVLENLRGRLEIIPEGQGQATFA